MLFTLDPCIFLPCQFTSFNFYFNSENPEQEEDDDEEDEDEDDDEGQEIDIGRYAFLFNLIS